jgi:hypothetical protein
VLNVYEPNDISHVYPAMGEEKFMKQVGSAWRKLLDIVSEPNDVITENYSVDMRRKN